MNSSYDKVLKMKFSIIYDALLNKLKRKERTQKDLDTIIGWLLGYTLQDIKTLYDSAYSNGYFLENAPRFNTYYINIKGKICGVQLEEITDETIRKLRCLDKLVDECYKGKPLDKILKGREVSE